MLRWLAAVITILVVTLGAWAPPPDLGWPSTADAAADREALDLDLEDPEPDGKATLSAAPPPPPPSAPGPAALGRQAGPREGAGLPLDEPPRI